mgnify:CR=1 FL=1
MTKRILQDRWLIALGALGIVAILILDLYALHQGVDGIIMGTSIALIAGIVAGLGGFRILKR